MSNAPKELRHNVVVFGETGVGKSSVINMIADNSIAKTSADASGCTFESKPHNATLKNKRIRIWDTAGLNEGENGTVTAGKAIIHLYHLLKGLEDGVSLLVLCMRAPRIRDSTVRNYKVFHHGLRLENVPIVLVVTGLEEEEDMDHWWVRNERVFEKQQMSFDGHACITATKGKQRNNQYMFATEYEESRVKVRKLVWDYCSAEVQKAEQPRLGVIGMVKVMFNIGTEVFHIPPLVLAGQLYKVLKREGGYSGKEAREIANKAEISAIRNAGGWVPRSNTIESRPS